FVAAEKEHPRRSRHGTAESAAKLIAMQRRRRQREKVSTVERRVADEFEKAAVIFRVSGLGHDRDDAAGRETNLCAIVRTLDRELLNGVDRREGHRLAGRRIVIIKAIEQEVILDILRANDHHAAATRRQIRVLRHVRDARGNEAERTKASAIERK